MCGIVGLAAADGPPLDKGLLEAMARTLAHRGPDAQGALLARAQDDPGLEAGLGHRRLSILDLSERGLQPMGGEDGAVQVVFNGEIYNHEELRADLEARGHVFASRTDTEVLVHGHEEYGPDFAVRLRGMFAYAVWDGRRGELTLVRDRMGKKPLYWMPLGAGLAFASEPKALARVPGFRAELDPRALARYLQHEYVPSPDCIFAGLRKLPAGSLLTWGRAGVRERAYWTPSFGGSAVADEAEARAGVERLLRQAVRRRLMSDVPLGVFLSGGVDSAAVTAFMAEMVEPSRIRTFSIGFEDAAFDESGHARRVADLLGTSHSERILRGADLLDMLPGIWAGMDEPLADPSIVPTALLSAFTREHVTVALGGDGGDELFAGYDPFLALAPARWAARLPGPLLAAAGRLAALIPVGRSRMGLHFRLRQFLGGLAHDRRARMQVWLGPFGPAERAGLLHPDVLRALDGYEPLDDVRAAFEGVPLPGEVDEMLYFFQRFYLEGDILAKVDRASMAHSLEVRAPFLDADLVDYVNALPGRMKFRGLARKRVLKAMLRGRLPDAVLDRPKQGFGIPLTAWLRGPLRELVRDELSPRRVREEGLFRPRAVERLLDEHDSGRRDHRKPIWTLLTLARWRDHFAAA